jgi:hypothetical protein
MFVLEGNVDIKVVKINYFNFFLVGDLINYSSSNPIIVYFLTRSRSIYRAVVVFVSPRIDPGYIRLPQSEK